MELKKGKYKKSEVQGLLNEQSFEYEYIIVGLKKEILNLKEELKNAAEDIKELKRTTSINKEEFNPKSKIKDYIKENCNGIDLEEAISVDDSQLGDICKDLGLTDEK